jgi:ribosomal protein L11 methyltransferase
MAWEELQVVLPPARAELAGAALMSIGAIGTQEDWLPGEAPRPRQPWDEGPPPAQPRRCLLRSWWDQGVDRESVLAAFLAHYGEGVEQLGWRLVEDEDWEQSWRRNFQPIRVSEGLTISPPWRAEPGDIILEPGMAFGTGEHPTTLYCLRGVARWARAGERCLDVGCGSGVLALAAAGLGMVARGTDIDPEAVRVARENAAINGLEVLFDDQDIAQVKGSYDLVVANLFAEVLIRLAPELMRVSSGTLVLAGILADRADRVAAAYSAMRLMDREPDPSGDWVGFTFSAR